MKTMANTQVVNRGALVKAGLAVSAWGASFIATKVTLQEVAPATVVWLRFALGAAVIGAVTLSRQELVIPSRRDLGYYALLGFLGIAFHQWLQSTGLVTAQASTTSWIVATTPVFIAILGRLFLNERLGWKGISGIGLAAGGVLLVVTKGDLRALSAGSFGTPGDHLILISALNWALFSVLSRRGLAQHKPATMIFYVMVIGWLFSSALFFCGPGVADIAGLSPRGWLAIVFLGMFCSGLAYLFWYDALERATASQVGAFLYLEPLITVVVAAVVLGEPILYTALLGGGLILFGVYLVNRPA